MNNPIDNQKHPNHLERDARYTAFIKVAGMRVPIHISKLFCSASRGEFTHESLRQTYISDKGLKHAR